MASTKTSAKGKAQVIADQFQEVALRASGRSSDSSISREYIFGVLNTILRVSGHSTVEETRKWDEYSQSWLALQAGRDLAAASLVAYKGQVAAFTRWLGKDKDIALNAVTGDLMQTWYTEALDEGRKPRTVNQASRTLQGIFDRARSEGFCPRNPVELIVRQYSDAHVRDPFTLDDITKILAYLRAGSNREWLTLALLGLCTGQRLQDCATARLEQFRPANGHVVWYCSQGKTDARVDVPIVEPLAAHLLLEKEKIGSGPLTPSLAVLPTGGTSGISLQFGKILDAAGVDRSKREKVEGSKGQSWTNKTFHSFRHTTNSLLANAGVSDDVRRKILGHTTTKMNMRYTHMEIETLAAALKKAIPVLAA